MHRLLALVLVGVPSAPAAEPAVRIQKGAATLDLFAGGELVAKYQYADAKPLAKPYLWPLHAPGGVPVTRAYPMVKAPVGGTTDHVHQKSVWFCHGDVIPDGVALKVKSADRHVKGVDFWSETPGHGRIVCVEVGTPEAVSADHAKVITRNEWRAADGLKVLDETRTLHLVRAPAGTLVVFDIDLHASVSPVTFGDTKEGSLGVRVHDALRVEKKDGGTVTSSGGVVVRAPAKDDLPLWGRPADWNDYSGTVDGKPVGLAVFDATTNTVRAAWHTRAYGLMAANPFGRATSGFPSHKGKTDLVRLAKGEHLKLRYGVYAHTGDAAAGNVAGAFAAFAGLK